MTPLHRSFLLTFVLHSPTSTMPTAFVKCEKQDLVFYLEAVADEYTLEE